MVRFHLPNSELVIKRKEKAKVMHLFGACYIVFGFSLKDVPWKCMVLIVLMHGMHIFGAQYVLFGSLAMHFS